MSTLLIRNTDAVVTCDKEDSMPRGVDLLCVDGIIQRIGKDLESQLKKPASGQPAPSIDRVIDASGMIA